MSGCSYMETVIFSGPFGRSQVSSQRHQFTLRQFSIITLTLKELAFRGCARPQLRHIV